ncbi:uncharacterized protein STEHIDRAFT_159239 [Stereum hirsutum FP-91666 SS1]|uniref:uncharacterized protein n=1 Tax=Stereum hirsutum (strain FP-91666) TaxID=721885 RepID=UPI000444A46F|nr:uncharacterized protein STEHIDRAFT_159239 [Stereum hirsutum FP-91666 SS1]EIM84574.1 hypothetical protein STEHIDRAFT_159239 [Stereum hirsutum FP-91666 SS1]
MREEYAFLNAKVKLIERDPGSLGAVVLLSPTLVTLHLAQVNRFILTLSTARTLRVDMSDLFTHDWPVLEIGSK